MQLKCKTCNVWLLPNDDFTLRSMGQAFESLGTAPYWFTFSGGEPTLRKDLPDMVASAYRHCQPGIINIPTNGIQHKVIPGRIEQVLKAAPKAEVIVNLSLDAVGCEHDDIRGVRNNWGTRCSPMRGSRSSSEITRTSRSASTRSSRTSTSIVRRLCEYVKDDSSPTRSSPRSPSSGSNWTPSASASRRPRRQYAVAIDTLLESMRERDQQSAGSPRSPPRSAASTTTS